MKSGVKLKRWAFQLEPYMGAGTGTVKGSEGSNRVRETYPRRAPSRPGPILLIPGGAPSSAHPPTSRLRPPRRLA